jgi:hypothetical protein
VRVAVIEVRLDSQFWRTQGGKNSFASVWGTSRQLVDAITEIVLPQTKVI